MDDKEIEETIDSFFNKLIKVSMSGEVHVFNEDMTKEEIHEKLDMLFGW